MQSSPRIEELRQKFHENPRRYFAPLANEYRKAGDSQQAIAICRAHLAQQPRHMSGHVVYGQALYDAGRTEEARVVFEQALALDPENVIVLRHLGDIARRSGDVQGARDWYSRALDLDPQDAEIAAYVAELTEPLTSRTEEAELPVTSENKPPIITRTLAELYLQQGHVDSALEIYRQLAVREPDDPSIRGRIDELVRDLEIEHPPSVEMPFATMQEPAVASSQDEAGQEATEDAGHEPTEPEIGSVGQSPAVAEPPELELTAENEPVEREDTAAPSPGPAERESQEAVSAETESLVPSDEKHFSESDLSSEPWDADDFWGTEAFAEAGETDEIFGLPYDSEVEPEEQPPSSERVAEHEAEAMFSEVGESTASGEDVQSAAATEAAVSESVTDDQMSVASSVSFDEVTPEVSAGPQGEASIAQESEGEAQPIPAEQASDAQTDAEPQADGDAEPQLETEAAPIPPKPEPEPVIEPALPATQATEPLIRGHEPPAIAEAPVWAARITVREFFATLGSARAPSGVSREEAAQPEATQAEAAQPEAEQPEAARPTPEVPAAPESEEKIEVPVAASEDAFSRLFADSPVSPEDNRAAAALSGAVAHEPALPSVDTHSDRRPSREPVSPAGRNEPPQESEEDLRRFREWLDGLTES